VLVVSLLDDSARAVGLEPGRAQVVLMIVLYVVRAVRGEVQAASVNKLMKSLRFTISNKIS